MERLQTETNLTASLCKGDVTLGGIAGLHANESFAHLLDAAVCIAELRAQLRQDGGPISEPSPCRNIRRFAPTRSAACCAPPRSHNCVRAHKQGEVDAATLRRAEDDAVREAVRQQEAIGLQSVTDGEFRRDWWHLDFMSQLDGVTLKHNAGEKFKVAGQEQPPIATVTGRIACSRPIMVEDFKFLKSTTTRSAKMTIPSPSMLHLRGGRASIDKVVYPDLDAFWSDVAAAYRDAIGHLADAGCRYLQLDDITFAYLCDPKIQQNCRNNGDDPVALPRRYADTINAALAGKPSDMTVTIHTCRGNFKSAWVAEGGYDPVVEAMFSTNVDGYFMEFDSSRAPVASSRCASCRAARRWCWAWSPPRSAISRARTTSSAASTRRRSSCRWKTCACHRSAASPARTMATRCRMSDQWRKLERVVEVAAEVWA